MRSGKVLVKGDVNSHSFIGKHISQSLVKKHNLGFISRKYPEREMDGVSTQINIC